MFFILQKKNLYCMFIMFFLLFIDSFILKTSFVSKSYNAGFNSFVLYFWDAVPCKNEMFLQKVLKIQQELGIQNCLRIYQKDNDFSKAFVCGFYNQVFQFLIIKTSLIDFKSSILQDFILYHEFRHHLQSRTRVVFDVVQDYQRAYNMTESQALEYDADMFALEKITEHYTCAYCLFLLCRSRNIKDYDLSDDGYLTELGVREIIKPYLAIAKKDCILCDEHKLDILNAYKKKFGCQSHIEHDVEYPSEFYRHILDKFFGFYPEYGFCF